MIVLQQVAERFKLDFHSSLSRVIYCVGLCLGAVLVSAGCVELEQTIELTSKNGGDFFIQAKVTEQVAAALERQSDGFGRFMDPISGAAYFKGKGVRISNYRVFKQRGSQRVIRITGEITDWKKVVSSNCLGPMTLADVNDHKRLSVSLPTTASTVEDALLKKAYAGVSLMLTIKTPTDIVSTSGKIKRSSTAVWHFDADDDISFLKKPPQIVVEYK